MKFYVTQDTEMSTMRSNYFDTSNEVLKVFYSLLNDFNQHQEIINVDSTLIESSDGKKFVLPSFRAKQGALTLFVSVRAIED